MNLCKINAFLLGNKKCVLQFDGIFRRTFSSSNAEAKVKPDRFLRFQPPSVFELDNVRIVPDPDFWNISDRLQKLLDRRLLLEDGNPLNLLKRNITNFFNSRYRKPRGSSPLFTICEDEPRLVTVFDNFDSLLIPADHPSRRTSDSYYVNYDYCLRAHTSAHQFKLMKQGLDSFLVIGDVYRRDQIDRTHFPCFHQIEGIRLYSPHELFGEERPGLSNMFKLFEAEVEERNEQKQEMHTLDTAKILERHLKQILEELCQALFGKDVQMRWTPSYFPFTHPSYELEVLFEGQWLEVLGCGIIEQKLLESAGANSKVGWAFGLGLERLAMVLYGIPDIRLFWSRDSGFLSQFAKLRPDETVKYKPISKQPQLAMDLSFWLPKNAEISLAENLKADVYDVIRSLGGDLVEQVFLFDQYEDKKTGKRSQAYRIVYRSMERPLSKDEVNLIHKMIENDLTLKFGIEIR